MTDAKLTAMANQIAAFFAAYPQDEAVRGIADHIVAFWTPGMRQALAAAAERGEPDMAPLVARAMLDGAPAVPSPIRKELAGPGVLGSLASDAG